MSSFKMNGQLTNSRTLTNVMYANQNAEFATDANDAQLLYYSNGAPTSSSALTFNSATSELNVLGSIVGSTGILGDASIMNLLIGTSFNLPASLILAYAPTVTAATGYTATAGSTGYTMDLGAIKLSWGSQQFTNVSGTSVAVQTVGNMGGVFTATPTLVTSIVNVGTDTAQYITGNDVGANSFNFFNNDTAPGGSFTITWFAIGV